MLAEYIGIAKLNDLIAHGAESECVASVADLSRVAQVVFDSDSAARSMLTVRLKFSPASRGSSEIEDSVPSISGTIDGELELECQRCLGAMQWPADIGFAYALQMPGSFRNMPVDVFEAIEVTDQGLLLKDLIEDELISAIPLAPKHDNEQLCARLIAAEVTLNAEVEQEETYQPFTGLADLLSDNSSDKDDEPNK